MIIFILIWCLIGLVSLWRVYHGFLKDWYIRFNESYWSYDAKTFKLLFIASPVFIMGGLFTLLYWEINVNTTNWYFTTKNKITNES